MATLSGSPTTIPRRSKVYDLQVDMVGAGGGTGATPSWTLSNVQSGDIAVASCVTRNATISTTVGGGGASFSHQAGFDTSSSEWHRYWWKQCASEGTSWNFSTSGTGAGCFAVFRPRHAPFLGLTSFSYNLTVTSPTFTVEGQQALVVLVYMGSAFGTISAVNQVWHSSNVILREATWVQQSSDECVSILWGVFPQGTHGGHYRAMNDGSYDSSAAYVFDFDVGGRR